ncbi:MAG TPA: DNA repair protein RadC [Dehalococcoidia bacterium]|nr:DNA repair protein RadC [Dehalococcoidia bacterium]
MDSDTKDASLVPVTGGRAEYTTRIREMPSSERPRERLRDQGPQALSNAELLAIILRTGSAKQSVLSLAASLLARHKGLAGLARLTFSDLVREHGLGAAKAAELVATFTLAQRIKAVEPEERPLVRSPADVNLLLGDEMRFMDQERLRVLLVNLRNQVTSIAEVYRGSVTLTQVRIAELFREAVRQNAPSIILVHNHPSGDPSPSADDVTLTKIAVGAGEVLQIEVLDHVIIGDRRWVSMKQMGLGFAS